MRNKITIAIQVYKRYEYLPVVCSYYTKRKLPVFICDNTDQEKWPMPPAIRSMLNKYNIRYVNNKNWLFQEKTMHISRLVDTPYILRTGDDDLVEYSAILAGIKFLDNNPGYSCTYGFRALQIKGKLVSPLHVNQGVHAVHNTIKKINDDFASDDPKQRIDHEFRYLGGLEDSICRTEVMHNIFRTIHENKQYLPVNFVIAIHALILAASGNIKYFKRLHTIKSVAPRMILQDWYPKYLKKNYLVIKHLNDIDFKPLADAMGCFSSSDEGAIFIKDKFKIHAGSREKSKLQFYTPTGFKFNPAEYHVPQIEPVAP